jgi:hypothetical protein
MSGKSAAAAAIAALLWSASSPDQKPGRMLVSKDPAYVEVVNDEQPRPPLLDVRFIPDLMLRQEGWAPHALRVDKGGNIYVFSGKDNSLTRFDASGRENLRKDFKSGQGPGEFGFFDPWIKDDGGLLVLDGRQRRLTEFDKDFKLLGVSRIGIWADLFRPDSAGNMVLMGMKFLPETRDRQLLVLTKASPQAKPLLEIHEYEWGLHRDAGGVFHSNAYRSQVKFQVDGRDRIWYLATDRYEINVVTPEGKLARRIVKKGEPRKLAAAEIDEFRPKDPKSMVITDIPERVPPVIDLFLLERGYVLAVTHEGLPGDGDLSGDVFDGDGVFRGRARVPKYDAWDFLLAPSQPMAMARGGFFYTVETPNDGDETIVRRYKIEIGPLKTR